MPLTGQEPVQVPTEIGTGRLLPAIFSTTCFAHFNDTEELPMNTIDLQAAAPGSTATADTKAAALRSRC